MVKVEQITEKPSVAIRIFLAGAFAFIIYTFLEKHIINYLVNLSLPLFLSQALFFGILVLIFDFILKEMGV